MITEVRVVQFWSEIILVISNRTRAARSFDFEIARMIPDQIALHSVQLPVWLQNYINAIKVIKNQESEEYFQPKISRKIRILSQRRKMVNL